MKLLRTVAARCCHTAGGIFRLLHTTMSFYKRRVKKELYKRDFHTIVMIENIFNVNELLNELLESFQRADGAEVRGKGQPGSTAE